MIAARSRTPPWAMTSAAVGPSLPMRISSGPSSRNEKPRSASSSCMDDTPTSTRRRRPRRRRLTYDRLQVGETILDQFEPPLRLFDEIGASCDGALVAIDADHARAGVARIAREKPPAPNVASM